MIDKEAGTNQMPEVKGIQVKGLLKFLSDRYGEDRLNGAFQSLSVKDQACLPSIVLDSSWYPHTIWRVVRRITRQLDPNGDSKLAIEMGQAMAHYAFRGAYRTLVVESPLKQVAKLPWINDLFYRNTRTVEIVDTGKSSCLIKYHYVPSAKLTRSSCLISMGFCIGILELSGAKEVKANHTKCSLNGSDSCEYSFQWK
jgi:hypothetical protein